MRIATASIFYLSALGCGVALINQSTSYSMTFGGIAIISYLSFLLINEHK